MTRRIPIATIALLMALPTGCRDTTAAPVTSSCTPSSCPDGCCDGDVCRPQSTSTCGIGGAACLDCQEPPDTDTCAANGTCVCLFTDSACPSGEECTDAGCVTCPDACCANCAGQCEGADDGCGRPCDANACTGCCDHDKECMAFESQSAATCGRDGESCSPCEAPKSTCSEGRCADATAVETQCTDGLDNDSDGLTDCADVEGCPTDAACDDGLFCTTTDKCDSSRSCIGTGDPCASRVGDDDDDCSESCDESAGNCSAPDPTGSSCNDDLWCNGADTCNSSGSCASHSGDPCGPVSDSDCAACSEGSNSCGAVEADGSACGSGGTCSGGMCTDACDSQPSGHVCCLNYSQFTTYYGCLSVMAQSIGDSCHSSASAYLSYRTSAINVSANQCGPYCSGYPSETHCSLYSW